MTPEQEPSLLHSTAPLGAQRSPCAKRRCSRAPTLSSTDRGCVNTSSLVHVTEKEADTHVAPTPRAWRLTRPPNPQLKGFPRPSQLGLHPPLLPAQSPLVSVSIPRPLSSLPLAPAPL